MEGPATRTILGHPDLGAMVGAVLVPRLSGDVMSRFVFVVAVLGGAMLGAFIGTAIELIRDRDRV